MKVDLISSAEQFIENTRNKNRSYWKSLKRCITFRMIRYSFTKRIVINKIVNELDSVQCSVFCVQYVRSSKWKTSPWHPFDWTDIKLSTVKSLDSLHISHVRIYIDAQRRRRLNLENCVLQLANYVFFWKLPSILIDSPYRQEKKRKYECYFVIAWFWFTEEILKIGRQSTKRCISFLFSVQ